MKTFVFAASFALCSAAHAQKVDTSVPPYPKVPNPNGFDLYVRAAKLIVPDKPHVDPVNDPELVTDPKVRAKKYSLAKKEAWLRKNAKGFALFQKALKTPTLHPNQRFEVVPLFPHYGTLRQLARYKVVERNAREMRGNWSGSVQSRLDTVQMGNDIGRGGTLIGGLVAIAIQSIGRDQPWAATEKLNLAQTRAAIKRLGAIYDRRLRPAEVLQEEKYAGLVMFRAQLRDPQWRDIRRWNPDATLSDRAQALTVAPEDVIRNYARVMDIHIANARLPLLAPQTPLPKPGDPFTGVLTPVFSRANLNFARNDAGNAVWLVALALRAHKLERGSYPSTLRALVPGFLREVPADPFGGGEPLRYKKTASSYLLWSIGPDGKDDSGKPISYRKNSKPTPGIPRRLPSLMLDSTGDYVAGKNR
ncbi:MAG TPA: hypothetical protein VF681_08670 [Abditibacteriaceae bacterium]|jgi:hypothetical protein